jgi:hypothetical protein
VQEQVQEPVQVQVEESEQEEAEEEGWVEKGSDRQESVYVLSAGRECPMSGGYPVMSRNVQSAIYQ